MNNLMNSGFSEHGEAFSIATLIYARLRRITGRLIDVMYVVESRVYAQYVVDLALAANDADLLRHAMRLDALIERENSMNPLLENIDQPSYAAVQQAEAPEDLSLPREVTDEEIYKAQVAHHYIGALR